MEQSRESFKPVRCKLCAAFAASLLPTAAERGLPGSETFSRDPDICDACLAQDYATIKRRFSLEWYTAQIFGGLFASVVFLALGYVHRKKGFEHFLSPRKFDPILASFLVAIVAGACFATFAWLVFKGMIWLRRWPIRKEIKRELAEQAPIDAERFRWLARWAELTGHDKFRTKMLRKTAAIDPSKGIDPPTGGL